MSTLVVIGVIITLLIKKHDQGHDTPPVGKGSGWKCDISTGKCGKSHMGTQGTVSDITECQKNCHQSDGITPPVIQSMFTGIPNCQNPKAAATQYYSNIKVLGEDVVNKILNNYTLDEDNNNAQAKIAADAINKFCQPMKHVDDKNPFCCNYSAGNSGLTCRPCASANNLICDVATSKDECNEFTKQNQYCGWKNGRCAAVNNKNPITYSSDCDSKSGTSCPKTAPKNFHN